MVTDISKCRDCGTDDPELLYESGRMERCYDCQNYLNLTNKKTGGQKLSVPISRSKFVAWKRSGSRSCHYCGLTEKELYSLQIINVRNKKPFESIGVDRLDNSLGYDLANLVRCCGPCNAVKSSILTPGEMQIVGGVLRSIWDARMSESETDDPDV